MNINCHIDTETRSTVDLKKTTAYEYARHPSTDLILVRWAVNTGPVHEWIALRDKKIPDDFLHLLVSPDITLVAHNAQFERSIFGAPHLQAKHWLPWGIPIARWKDTAAMAARQALPRALGNVGKVLKLPIQKDNEGYLLMMKMCKPQAWIHNDDTGI